MTELVVNQVNDAYQVRGEKMVAYLEKAKELIVTILVVTVEVAPSSKNANVDALTKLAFTKNVELLNTISVELLAELSIKQ